MDLITTPAAQYTVPSGSVVYPASAWLGASRGIAEPVQLVQYDDTLPILAVALYLNGQPYTLPEGAAVNIRMDKHDGHYVYNPALGVSEDRQTAYIGVTLQMTTVAGCFAPALEIVVDGEVAGTSNIPVVIAANQVPEDAVASTDEFKTIQQLAAEVTQAAQIVQDNAEGIAFVQQHGDDLQAVADNAASLTAVGEDIANVNAAAEHMDAILAAPQAATNAASSAQAAATSESNAENSATLAESWAVGGTGTRSGEDTDNAKFYAEQAQQVSQGAVGWYETEQALQAAHPTGQNGQWAIIGTTDTIWTWDSDTSAWVNTGSQIDLSNYYQKQEANARFQMPIGYVFEWASVPEQSVDLSSPEKVAQYFGYGTWAAFGEGQFLLGVGGSYQAGSTGGEAEHTLTKSELPNESLNIKIAISGDSGAEYAAVQGYTYVGANPSQLVFGNTDSLGSGTPINNMPPYIVVYRWQRIA